MKKKLLSVMVCGLTVALLAIGCTKQTVEDAKETTIDLSGEEYTIGISQFAEHESLNECKTAFLDTLASAGLVEGENLTVIYQCAGNEEIRAKQIATSFLSSDVNLVYGIGTTSAQTVCQSFANTDIPVVFAAVTDPIRAELADEDGVQKTEITGISNPAMVEEALELIQNILPKAKKVGIIYSANESNAKGIVEEYRNNAPNYGMELVTRSVDAVQNISGAADEILPDVDCLINITDNGVTSTLSNILAKANEMQIPVFGSDMTQVKMGCIAAAGVNYTEIGNQAGDMALQILAGERKASEIAFRANHICETYVNTSVAETLEIEIPEEVLENAAETFDDVEENEE